MGRSAVLPLSAESDAMNSMSVVEKLSQLTAVQYNLSEPQAAQAFAASGDTVAAAPLSVTDIQALEKTHYGLDAEVLKEVYPDLVYESQEGDLCINYTEMIPLLVQSVSNSAHKWYHCREHRPIMCVPGTEAKRVSAVTHWMSRHWSKTTRTPSRKRQWCAIRCRKV